MSESAGQLIAEIGGRDIGLDQLLDRAIARLRAAEEAAQAAGAGISEGLGNGSKQAEASVSSLVQAQARLDVATGNNAQAIARLQAALTQEGVSEQQRIAILTQIAGLETRAQSQTLALASAKARASAEAGQFAQAEQTLEHALAGVDRETTQSIALQRQLAQVQEQAKNGASQQSGALEGLNGKLNAVQGALGGVGLALGAQQIVQGGIELAKTGADAQQAAAAFDKLTASAGQSGAAILSALQKASHGEISDMNLQLAASRAQVLGVAKSTQDFSTLMEIARSRAQLLGSSTEQAFSDLVTGLGRGSALILDNLGIMVKVGEANETYAKSLGKSASALTAAEQKQALINAVMKQGQETLAATGGAADGNAQSFQRLSASMENLKAKAGGVLANLLGPAADGAVQLTSLNQKIQQTSVQVLAGSQSWAQYQQRTQFVNQQLGGLAAQLNGILPGLSSLVPQVQGLTQAQYNYAQSLVQQGATTDAAIAKAQAMNSTLISVGEVQKLAALNGDIHGAALDKLVNSMINVSSMSAQDQANVAGLAEAYKGGQLTAEQFQAALSAMAQQHVIAAEAAATEGAAQAQRSGEIMAGQQSTEALSQALTVNTENLVQNAQQAQQTALQTQTLNQMQSTLASLGPAVAGGLISASNAAAQLAGQYNIAADAALQLVRAQAQLAQAKVNAQGLQNQRAGERDAGNTRIRLTRSEGANNVELTSRGADSFDQVTRAADTARAQAAKSRAEAAKMHDAELALARAHKDRATEVNLLRQEQAGLTKGSAEYLQVQAKIDSAEEKGAKGGGGRKGKAGGGAGAAKISEQQKVNNQLSDIQTQFQQKSEDSEAQFEEKRESAARQHLQKLVDIQRQYNDKELAAQKSYQLSSLNSRADFYDKLTGSKELGEGVQKQISAAYEAAQQKAAQLSQSGQAKLGQEYLKLKESQLSAEIDFQQKVQQAQESKDKAEVSRLQQIEVLRKAAQAEEEKQLLEGGDDDVNARNKAAADESQRYADQQQQITDDQAKAQAKLETAASRAADKKVEAAQRSGKAIAVENTLLERQAAIYDRMNGARSGGAPTPTGSAAPAPTSASGISDDDQRILNELQNVRSTVADGQAAQQQANAPVVAAVNGVQSAVTQQKNQPLPPGVSVDTDPTQRLFPNALPPGVSVEKDPQRLFPSGESQALPAAITQALQPSQDRVAAGVEALRAAMSAGGQGTAATGITAALGPLFTRVVAGQQQTNQQQAAQQQTTTTAMQQALDKQTAVFTQIGNLPALKGSDAAPPAAAPDRSTPAPVTLPAETPRQISEPIVAEIGSLQDAITDAFAHGMEELQRVTRDGLNKVAAAVASAGRNTANRMP